ncbi:hypothetical protein [Bacteroides sp. 224]|uniref:hypothetical protein n=1 Tax=Bacteroides sp. 224 TaxID=2302936 RepID=UPI0013D4BD99|nr:hypothetical protein [Bacteroides sp. 224]NDV63736.1 hypothetical protein [Bacteroides sp. 224]
MFDWNNFVVDSRDTYYGACHKDKVVNNPMIYNEIFDPVADDVENFFYYNGDGSIIPLYTLSDQDKQKVIKTVEVFNLNHRTLKNRRAELLKELEEWGGSLSDDEVKAAFSKYGFKSVLEQKLRERRMLEVMT